MTSGHRNCGDQGTGWHSIGAGHRRPQHADAAGSISSIRHCRPPDTYPSFGDTMALVLSCWAGSGRTSTVVLNTSAVADWPQLRLQLFPEFHRGRSSDRFCSCSTQPTCCDWSSDTIYIHMHIRRRHADLRLLSTVCYFSTSGADVCVLRCSCIVDA